MHKIICLILLVGFLAGCAGCVNGMSNVSDEQQIKIAEGAQ